MEKMLFEIRRDGRYVRGLRQRHGQKAQTNIERHVKSSETLKLRINI